MMNYKAAPEYFLSLEQEQIIQDLSVRIADEFIPDMSKHITNAQTLDELQELREHFEAVSLEFRRQRQLVPLEGQLYQYRWLLGETYGTTDRPKELQVVDNNRPRKLSLLGNHWDATVLARENLTRFIEAIPTLVDSLDARERELKLGPNAPTPYRELGLLLRLFPVDQLMSIGQVLEDRAGTADLRPLNMTNAAIILNELRDRMDFEVRAGCKMHFTHQKGTTK
ncbi:MAG: hypothetical protein SGJ05_10360 [bacterium]|nr:hypothetical protein [bacterium]